MKLTDKQARFCREYVIDLNATQAAIRAGYNERSARQIGAENLSKPYIQKRINELQADLEEATGLTAIRILEAHKAIAFSPNEKTPDRQKSLDSISRILGFDTDKQGVSKDLNIQFVNYSK